MRYFLILSVILLTSFGPHKFYVSNTVMDHNPLSQSFEITMKIFTDDLERALEERVNERLFIGDDELEDPNTDSYLNDYLMERFHVAINDMDQPVSFIGKEVDFDLTYCYLEVTGVIDLRTITVANDILYDIYPEQANIVDVEYQGWQQKLMLTQFQPVQTVVR